jgi:23S rRNA (cytosine1962-C5)-methyltransferase
MDRPHAAVRSVRFWAKATASRHLGVFPEARSSLDWTYELLSTRSPAPAGPATDGTPRVLNLFGYTGLATLAAAAAGAAVTHVDASRTAVSWARENQTLSGLQDATIRWVVEDALKYVQREGRRGMTYDGIILEPPKFGRGPKGEVWELYKALPALLDACRAVMSSRPRFVLLTIYAVRASALHVLQALQQILAGYAGTFECGSS